MSHRCLAVEELDRVHALALDDPLRRAAAACPRCRRLMSAYVEFLEDRGVPEAIDPQQAAARLRAAFERALQEPAGTRAAGRAEPTAPTPPPAEPASSSSPAPSPPSPASRPARAIGSRPPRIPFGPPSLAWGVVAVLVLAIGWYLGPRGRARPDADRLRAAPDSTAVRAQERPVLGAPRAVAAGVELRWSAVAGADAYRLVFLDADLAPIASLGPVADTIAVLASGHLPAGLGAGRTVAWQVEALEGGYPIASSETALLKVP